MKRIFTICLTLGLIILILPAIAFLPKYSDKNNSNNSPKISFITPNSQENEPEKSEQSEEYLNKKDSKENSKEIEFYSVLDHNTQKLLNLTPLEYIKGVVAAEMPCLYEVEALKAQAVCAHTYALVQLEQYGYTLSTDPAVCQGYMSKEERIKFWGNHFNEYEKKLTDAVKCVINEAITVDEKPILAAFHAISSGKTESAKNVWQRDIPYLVPVVSNSDKSAPDYKTEEIFTDKEISKKLLAEFPKIKFDRDKTKWFQKIQKSDSGNVLSITVGNTEMTGNKLRELLSLRSADFDISYKDEAFIFTVYGYGHFVGMSQYGANEMAKSGCSYEDILLHYYNGANLTLISHTNF